MSKEELKEWERAKVTDSTVFKMLCDRQPLENIIAQLVKEKETQHNELVALRMITPKRYRLASGTILHWAPPGELIPITDLNP